MSQRHGRSNDVQVTQGGGYTNGHDVVDDRNDDDDDDDDVVIVEDNDGSYTEPSTIEDAAEVYTDSNISSRYVEVCSAASTPQPTTYTTRTEIHDTPSYEQRSEASTTTYEHTPSTHFRYARESYPSADDLRRRPLNTPNIERQTTRTTTTTTAANVKSAAVVSTTETTTATKTKSKWYCNRVFLLLLFIIVCFVIVVYYHMEHNDGLQFLPPSPPTPTATAAPPLDDAPPPPPPST